jgi:hypothetical protein
LEGGAIILQDALPPSNVLLNAVVGRVTEERDNGYPVDVFQHGIVMRVDLEMSLIYTSLARCAQALWKDHNPDTERLFIERTGNKLSPELAKECVAKAKEALLQPKLLKFCLEQREQAGVVDDNGEEVAYMLAELMHQVFIKGFNSAEVRGPHQRWYVD